MAQSLGAPCKPHLLHLGGVAAIQTGLGGKRPVSGQRFKISNQAPKPTSIKASEVKASKCVLCITKGAKTPATMPFAADPMAACKDEAINPRTPSRLPLLFALDAKLDIPGGFHYAPDCANLGPGKHPHHDGGRTYFGTSFSDGSFTGSADDFGGMDSADASAGDGGAGDGGGNGCGGGGSGGD